MNAEETVTPVPSTVRWSSYKKFVIGILLVVYTFNFIDRQIIAILSPAIQADLGINDTQLGFLKGFAFALFYSVFSIPVALLADKKNRVTIISVSIAFWSAMTALCGAAGNFWHLLATRIGVGIGEAGCSPPAHSLVSDYFYKEERATALGIYSLGIPLGSLFGILLGGWLAGTLGWRWAFVAVGIPGILLAIIVKITLKEPVRGAAEARNEVIATPVLDDEVDEQRSVMNSFRIIWQIKSFRILLIGSSLTAFASYAFSLWVVELLFRVHELSVSQLTLPLAMCIGVGGAIGTVTGGVLCDYWVKRKDVSAYFVFIGLAHGLSVPFFILATSTSSTTLCFISLFFVFMLHSSVAGPAYALVQNLSPLKMRAFSSAIFVLGVTIIGLGFGPVYLGTLSDMLGAKIGAAPGLQNALISLAPIWLLAAIIFIVGRRNVSKDII